MSTLDNDVFVNLVNRNHNSKRDVEREERIRQYLEKCEKSANISIEKENVRYYYKKKKSPTVVNQRIISIILSAVLISGVTAKITTDVVDRNNVLISETKDIRDYIDDRIEYYENLMNMYSDDDNKIETSHGRNSANNDVLVSYNEDILAKHIYDAALISESEARCVVIAAFRIINEPYRENVLRKTFSILKSSYQFDKETQTIFGQGFDSFLEHLNYQNLEEYNSQERANIKEFKAVEQYWTNHKGM